MKKRLIIALLFLGFGVIAYSQDTTAVMPSKAFEDSLRYAIAAHNLPKFTEQTSAMIEKIVIRKLLSIVEREDETLTFQIDSMVRNECFLTYNLLSENYTGGFWYNKKINEVSTTALLGFVEILRDKQHKSLAGWIQNIEAELQRRYSQILNPMNIELGGLKSDERGKTIVQKYYVEYLIKAIIEP